MVYAVVAGILLGLFIVQIKRVPCNDYFVLKASIYLSILTLIRVGSCLYLFFAYQKYLDNDYYLEHYKAFGIIITNVVFDVPVFALLLIFYSVIFSAYKLYLVFQEMLGFSNTGS